MVTELTFTQLALEDSFDTITVYDGRNAGAPVLGVYTGTDIPGDVESTGNAVFVMFHTDAGNAGLSGVASDPGFFMVSKQAIPTTA